MKNHWMTVGACPLCSHPSESCVLSVLSDWSDCLNCSERDNCSHQSNHSLCSGPFRRNLKGDRAPRGHPWTFQDTPGYPRIYPRISSDTLRYLRISWEILGYLRISEDIPGYPKVSWYPGIYQDIQAYPGIPQDISRHPWISWDSGG